MTNSSGTKTLLLFPPSPDFRTHVKRKQSYLSSSVDAHLHGTPLEDVAGCVIISTHFFRNAENPLFPESESTSSDKHHLALLTAQFFTAAFTHVCHWRFMNKEWSASCYSSRVL